MTKNYFLQKNNVDKKYFLIYNHNYKNKSGGRNENLQSYYRKQFDSLVRIDTKNY